MDFISFALVLVVLGVLEWRSIRAEREREQLYTRIMCRDVGEYEAIVSKPPAGRAPIAEKMREYDQTFRPKEK